MNPMAVRTCCNHRATRTRAAAATHTRATRATRAAWRSTAARAAAAALLCLCTAAAGLQAATLAEGKAAAAAGDHPRAGQIFSTVRDSGAAAERAEAAFLALYEHREAGNHAAVQAQYDASLAATRGTRFESRCIFEYAKSLHYNARDTTEAMRLYERISEEFPLEAFSASGSILEMGRIQLNDWAAPNTACDTFELAVSQYPDSPFADDALVAQAETAVKLARVDLIDSADRRLTAMVAPAAMLQKVQFQRGEFHSKVRADRFQAIEEYMKTARDFPGKSHTAALAKIRAADLVVQGDFELSRRMYEEVLAGYPALPRSQREWARLRIGIYHYQRHDEQNARRVFEELLTDSPSERVGAEARLYLAGMSKPESMESVQILFDRGLRYWQTGMGRDVTFMDTQQVLAKSRQPWFQQALGRMDGESRGEAMVKLAFAEYFCGRGDEALRLASQIIEGSGAPQGGMSRVQAEYMRAFLLVRSGEYSAAATAWRKFVEDGRAVQFLPQAYLEYSRALHLAGDQLGAVLALEELMVRFPARRESQDAADLLEEHLRRRPALRPEYLQEKPAIVAKWKGKEPPRVDDPDAEEPMLSLDLSRKSTGGAQ